MSNQEHNWTGRFKGGLRIDPGEMLMLCLDRVYEGQPDQVEWRLGELSKDELRVAEENVEKLLGIIREVRSK